MEKALAGLVRFLSGEELHVLDMLVHKESSKIFGRIEDINQNQSYWDSVVTSWQHCPSPVRPSAGDIALYERFLKNKEGEKRILILGATPELRDVAANTENSRVYVADFSSRMLQEMSQFTRNVRISEETWLKCDWLDIPCPAGFFDVILGDLALQQFPPGLEAIFLEKIHFLLHPDGLYIGRFQVLDDRIRSQKIEYIIKTVTAHNLEKDATVFLLHLHLLWRAADPVSRVLDRHGALNAFEEFLRQHGKKLPILKNVHDLLLANKDSYRNWSPATKDQLIRTLSEYFIIHDNGIADDYPEAPYFPIFMMKKVSQRRSNNS